MTKLPDISRDGVRRDRLPRADTSSTKASARFADGLRNRVAAAIRDGPLGRLPGFLGWKWRPRWTRVLVATQAFAAMLLLCRGAGWLQPAELFFYDRLVVAWAGDQVSDKITLVAISEDDISENGWPLRDNDLAALLERLTGWGARVIGVDLYRDQPLPPGSERLAELRREHPEIIWVFKLPGNSDKGVAPPKGAADLALADVVTDSGGVVRRGLLAATDGPSALTYPTLGTALAETYTGQRLRDVDEHSVMLGTGRIGLISDDFGPYARTDAAGYQTMLDFLGGQERFRKFSLHELMTNDAAEARARDGIVLVGTGALSVKDSFATPLSTNRDTEPLLGVSLHAHLADQLIRMRNGETKSRETLSKNAESFLIGTCAFLGGVAVLLISSIAAVVTAVVLGLGLIASTCYLAFGYGLMLPVFAAGSAWLGAAGTGIVALYGIGIRERLRLRRSFEHYLDPRIIQDMIDQEKLPVFGGEHREISVMFTDLTGFTTMSEAMAAPQLASLLHDYFDATSGAVLACGGLVSEFMGDGLLALFGAPQAQDDHADRAVDAALKIDALATRFSAAQQAQGIAWGDTRIGVHSGLAMVGNVGTRRRLRYGAVGDVMNTASRLVGVNKRIGTRIAVSGETIRGCRRHRFQPVGEFVVMGRHAPLAIATPLAPDGDSDGALARYNAAYEALKGGSEDVAVRFHALRLANPSDPCIAFHVRRLANGESGVRIKMEEK